MTVTAPRAREESAPAGVEPLDWRLLTHRAAATLAQAAELIQWYGTRWRIEAFFSILKTGCRVEALRLSTLERLEPALALYLVIAWRIQYLTVLGRVTPDLPCDAVLDPAEWRAVYVAIHRRSPPITPPLLPAMLGWIARLGGGRPQVRRPSRPPRGPLDRLAARPRPCLGDANWSPISMPIQPVRDVWNRQRSGGGWGRTTRPPPCGQPPRSRPPTA